MDDIRSLIDAAARRLAMGRLLRGVHLGLVGVGILAFLLVLLAKSSPAVALPWPWLAWAGGAVVVIVGIVAMRWGRPSRLSVATLVDERLGLKERLSTALAVCQRSDPFALAAVADAVATAKDKRTREALGRGIPVKAPDASWLGPALLLATGLAAWLVPQGDLFRGKDSQNELLEAALVEANAAVREVERRIAENPLLSEALGVRTDDLTNVEQVAPKDLKRTPEEIRREAIKRMSELEQRLNAVLRGEEALKMDALKRELANLKPEDNDAEQFVRALRDGDFSEAKKALEALRKKAEGKSDEERAALEQQLKDVAKQVEQLAARQEALKQALERAGMDGQLASNPEALKQVLENASNLTQAQREAIEKAMNAQKAAQDQLKGMSNAIKQAAQEMCQSCEGGRPGGQEGQKQGGRQGQQGQDGQEGGTQSGNGGSGQGLEGMLSDMEALQQMLAAAEAAAAEASSQSRQTGKGMGQMAGACQGNCDGDGAWRMIDGLRQGGRGRAGGGETPTAPTPAGTRMQKERVERTDGPIIMRQLVEGRSEPGQSSVGVDRIAAELARSMEQGVTEEQVPAHLRAVHKHYFGDLKRRLDAKQRESAPADPEQKAP
jgi:hypothetical protein